MHKILDHVDELPKVEALTGASDGIHEYGFTDYYTYLRKCYTRILR